MKKIILLISLTISLYAYNNQETKELNINIKTELEKYKSSLDISLVLEVNNSLEKKEIETKLKNIVISSLNMYDKSYFYSKTSSNQMLKLMLEHDIKQTIVKKNKKVKKVYISNIIIIDPVDSKAISTKELYNKKCASCHGRKGLQRALGMSNQIANMNKDEIYKALKAYKKHDLNKYGRATYMWRYVESLNDKNLHDLSIYIDNL